MNLNDLKYYLILILIDLFPKDLRFENDLQLYFLIRPTKHHASVLTCFSEIIFQKK